MSESMGRWSKKLTGKTLQKYFDSSCEACKHATMQRKTSPNTSTTTYLPGARCTIDIANYTDLELGCHSKALHAVNVGSGTPFIVLLHTLTNLIDLIKYIHRHYMKVGHKLDTVVINTQFVTEEVIR